MVFFTMVCQGSFKGEQEVTVCRGGFENRHTGKGQLLVIEKMLEDTLFSLRSII